jgi:hypothetical protein
LTRMYLTPVPRFNHFAFCRLSQSSVRAVSPNVSLFEQQHSNPVRDSHALALQSSGTVHYIRELLFLHLLVVAIPAGSDVRIRFKV